MNISHISSWCLLGGILTGFLLASWEGHRASTYSKPANFQRFHQRISPDTLYYPPYRMLENLALARWRPGKTVVIIGGNSILNGISQPQDEVWSVHLQEQLGESYVVVNLAFRGAFAAQGGALVAEALLQRDIPFIYIANTSPVSGGGRAVGGAYGYFYWQALYQRRLSPFPERQADIHRWLESLPPKEREQQQEERLGGILEAFFRHQSLWHHVGYRHFFTVWNVLLLQNPWVPRASLPDNELYSPPLPDRFKSNVEQEMAIVRNFTGNLSERDARGQWRLTEPVRQQLTANIDAAFTRELRPHMLMLLSQNAPYYRDQLTPLERMRDDQIYDACARLWQDRGIGCIVAGRDFEPIDYNDRTHLSTDGGRKLAALVAENIRRFKQP